MAGVRFLLLLAATLLFAAVGWSHPTSFASAQAKVQADGSFTLFVRFDLPAFMLGEVPARVDDALMAELLGVSKEDLGARLGEAESRFRSGFAAQGPQPAAELVITFPTLDEIHAMRDRDEVPLPLMATVAIKGKLREGSREIHFRFPEALGVTILTVELPYQEPISEPVEAGAQSTAFRIPTPEEVDKAAAAISAPRQADVVKPEPPKMTREWQGPPKPAAPLIETVTREWQGPLLEKDEPQPSTPEPAQEPAAAPVQPSKPAPWYMQAARYVKIGFEHILPGGLDHILFVLGLFLIGQKAKPLVKQITAFTIAHSLTLALSLYGMVRLPSEIVEPLIAASIAFVAIENLYFKEMKSWRPWVVFGFGLVHGMGFASALEQTGLARGSLFNALLGFNIGVELGQLGVVGLAFLAVGWFRKSESYRTRVIVPASAAIALVALFWTVERIL